jgi:hypothetical protein
MTNPLSHRKFTPDEVRSILRSAARRQSASEKAAASVSTSLTIDDLERAAAEAGIDAEHVRRAASDLLETDEDAGVVVRRTLPGPVSEEAWAGIVAELRRTYRGPGSTGAVGTTREWTSSEGAGYLTVHATLQSRDGETTLTLRREASPTQILMNVVAASLAGVGAFLGVVSLFGSSGMSAVVFLVAVFGVAALLYGSGPAVDAWLRRREEEDLEATLNRAELVAMKHQQAQDSTETPAPVARNGFSAEVADVLTTTPAEDTVPRSSIRRRGRQR